MDRTDRFLIFVGVSILVHILLWLSLSHYQKNFTAMNRVRQPLMVQLRDPRESRSSSQKPIVKVDQPKAETAPDNARFYAEQNARAEREMRARQSGMFRNSSTPSSSQGQQASQQQRSGEGKGLDKGLNTNKSTDGLGPGTRSKRGSGDGKLPGVGQLLASAQQEIAQTYDHLDAPEGDKTLLNTKEYIYAGFFNRIKERIYPMWESRVNDIIHRRMAELRESDYVTVLKVILDREGSIVDISVNDSSGFSSFDRAATDSFWDAKQFPNPPKALFSGEKVADFTFSFFVGLQKSGFVRMNTVPDPRYYPSNPGPPIRDPRAGP